VVGLESGSNDYIAKPFGVREVTARIRAITRRVMLANNPQTKNKTLSFTLGDLVALPD
jgi:two-component system OmpR family response regulator